MFFYCQVSRQLGDLRIVLKFQFITLYPLATGASLQPMLECVIFCKYMGTSVSFLTQFILILVVYHEFSYGVLLVFSRMFNTQKPTTSHLLLSFTYSLCRQSTVALGPRELSHEWPGRR